jgi:hypothetical protein
MLQARHLVTLRKPAYVATDRQLAWFERYGVRLLLTSHPEYPPALIVLLLSAATSYCDSERRPF